MKKASRLDVHNRRFELGTQSKRVRFKHSLDQMLSSFWEIADRHMGDEKIHLLYELGFFPAQVEDDDETRPRSDWALNYAAQINILIPGALQWQTPAQRRNNIIKKDVDHFRSYVPRLVELGEIVEQQDYQRLASFRQRETDSIKEDRLYDQEPDHTGDRKMLALWQIEKSQLVYVTIKLEPRKCNSRQWKSL